MKAEIDRCILRYTTLNLNVRLLRVNIFSICHLSIHTLHLLTYFRIAQLQFTHICPCKCDTNVCLPYYLFFCLFVSPPVRLFCPSSYMPICLSAYLPACLCVCQSVLLHVYSKSCLFVYLFLFQRICHMSICLCIYILVFMSVSLYTYTFLCKSAYQSV